jgi:hypothetical protein
MGKPLPIGVLQQNRLRKAAVGLGHQTGIGPATHGRISQAEACRQSDKQIQPTASGGSDSKSRLYFLRVPAEQILPAFYQHHIQKRAGDRVLPYFARQGLASAKSVKSNCITSILLAMLKPERIAFVS